MDDKASNGSCRPAIEAGRIRASFPRPLDRPLITRLGTILFLLSLSLLASPTARAVEDSVPAALRERYDEAFKLYTAGEYAKAIQKWNDILVLDANQKSAQSMIQEAREKISLKVKESQERLIAFIRKGQYDAALLELQPLMEQDSSLPLYKTLQSRLDSLSKIVPKAPDSGADDPTQSQMGRGTGPSGSGKAWQIAVSAVAGVLKVKEELRFAHNGLRYACEIDPKDEKLGKLLDWLLTIHPELTEADPVTPGMKLLDYKRLVALHHIYDGKYHLAAQVLGEVLALEPKDIMALKRLGSAYFALGNRDQARAAWADALLLAPNDPQLLKFLKKLGADAETLQKDSE